MHTPNAILAGLTGPYASATFPVAGERVEIGREPTSTIALPLDSGVSARHCVLTREGSAYVVRDLGSANGTYVNGARIQACILRPGDQLHVGASGFQFLIPGALPYPPHSKPRSSILPWVMLAVLVVVVALAVILPAVVGVATRQPISAPELPPSESSSVSGLFTESASPVETPTIRVSSDVAIDQTLRLTAANGATFWVTFSSQSPGTLQVPAGEYSVEISSVDTSILPNSGTAVFRRYREYEASFTVGPASEARPLRLGDQ